MILFVMYGANGMAAACGYGYFACIRPGCGEK